MNWLDLLFPPPKTCGFCDRKSYEKGICKLCWSSLEPIENKICERCGRPSGEIEVCGDCTQRHDTYFMCNRSAFQYNDKMKEVMSLYKYRGDESLADIFATLLFETYEHYYARLAFDAITFVPLHDQRLRERGFNQARQLATLLSGHTKIPMIELLYRTRYTEKQSKKYRDDRIKALGDLFEVRSISKKINRVLLVDDVYTTGSTVNECARVLARKGILVYTITLAR